MFKTIATVVALFVSVSAAAQEPVAKPENLRGPYCQAAGYTASALWKEAQKSGFKLARQAKPSKASQIMEQSILKGLKEASEENAGREAFMACIEGFENLDNRAASAATK